MRPFCPVLCSIFGVSQQKSPRGAPLLLPKSEAQCVWYAHRFKAARSLSNLRQDLTWRLCKLIQFKSRFSSHIGVNPIGYAYSLFTMLGDLLSEQCDPQVHTAANCCLSV